MKTITGTGNTVSCLITENTHGTWSKLRKTCAYILLSLVGDCIVTGCIGLLVNLVGKDQERQTN